MKLDKGIEALGLLVRQNERYLDNDEIDAIKLGIEALKRVKAIREGPDIPEWELLPGETEE